MITETGPKWTYRGKFFPRTHRAFDNVMDFGNVAPDKVDAKGTTEYVNRSTILGGVLALLSFGAEVALALKGMQIPVWVPLATAISSVAVSGVAAKIGEARSGVTAYINKTYRRSTTEEPQVPNNQATNVG